LIERERNRERGHERTESAVARDEHDRLLVDRASEPVRAYVPLRERGELRYVLDADNNSRRRACARVCVCVCAAGYGAVLLLLLLLRGGRPTLRPGDEVVQDAGEVARTCADVQHACATAAGMTAQVWEEELG